MKIKIRLLQPFKSKLGKDAVEVNAKKGNVASALEALCVKHPELSADILPQGKVSQDVSIVLNETPLAGDKPYDRVKVSSSDEIVIFLPISGG